ncbi:hypothetical protein A9W99_08165 [Mycobacterium sp. 1164966.3]|nr:hypothetical protein A9W99_08165 [Mycobacterium sp. 1164966.3]
MSQSSYDAPTGPIRGGAPAAPVQAAGPGGPAGEPVRRRNVTRDLIAAGLLVLAPFLPWNLYFGVGVPDSKTVLFAVLAAVTLVSLIGIAVPAGRLRLLLNVPYWLLVLAFIGYDVYETIRSGGSVHVPGGVGPGAWLGMAGSVLSAQPLIIGPAAAVETPDGWSRSARVIGYVSMIGATLSSGFNLFWRVRFAMHDTTGAGFGKQNIVVIVTATVYGLVAWVAVLIASRWLVKSTKAAHLALVALGASALVAGPLVWFLPIGRDIDSFHGIAQNTSTAGVGYEGYLAWAVGAAIFAPRVLPGYRRGGPDDAVPWRNAARMGCTLIVVWCVGSALMRITDFTGAVILNYPYSRYDSMTLAAFDLATAALAIWLRIKLATTSIPTRLTTSLTGLLVTIGIARVVLGVWLAPRFVVPPGGGGWNNPVYGNNLAHQITSTFDVALCGLALGILLAVRISGHLSGRRRRRRRRRVPVPAARQAGQGVSPPPSAAATTRIPAGGEPQLAGSGAPRIFRGDDSATQQISLKRPTPKIYRPPQS